MNFILDSATEHCFLEKKRFSTTSSHEKAITQDYIEINT